jgi:hypothetical protein
MKRILPILCTAALATACTVSAADLHIVFPLTEPPSGAAPKAKAQTPLPQRTAYQTNERIEVSVVRSAGENLAAGTLSLTLAGDDASKLAFTFPTGAAAAKDGAARTTEHFYLDARLLRPGHYRLRVEADGASAESDLDIYSHVRGSTFKIVNWGGGAKGPDLWKEGEDSLGYNVFLGFRQNDPTYLIRAGVDFMQNCTMSGGHQMDLRSERDWSDPRVTRGGTIRVVRQAFADRVRGNTIGVHFYDEPGLTWVKDPATGEMSPHAVPWQARSYEAAFNRAALDYKKVDPANPSHTAQWEHWARWKLGIVDAAWRESQFGVSHVRADLLSTNQSQYGWTAFTDGYYFNVQRSLPITLGHGGYDDFGPGYFNPSLFLEMARARDRWKDCWYLPTWYTGTFGGTFRLEQYLSFQTGIQGLMTPPGLDPVNPSKLAAAQEIVESNHLMRRLGTIFTTMRAEKPPVALLYSLSQCIHSQMADMKANYAHAIPHGRNLPLTYLAGKLIQHQFQTILDEDIVDGTLANDHRAVILTSLDYLAPNVVAALEDFAAQGGLVLATSDCTVKIKGAVTLPVKPEQPNQAQVAAVAAEIANLSEQMKEPGDDIKAARAEVAAIERELRPLEALIKKQEADLAKLEERLKKESANPNKQVQKLEAEVAAEREQLKAAKAKLAEREQSIAAKNIAMEPKVAAQKVLQEKLMELRRGQLRLQDTGAYFKTVAPLAAAIRPALEKAGIAAVFQSDVPTIIASRHSSAEIEYVFAVNATFDEAGSGRNAVKGTPATIALPGDGRPVYDAIHGGQVEQFATAGGKSAGKFSFGPGQMRVFARTARPLGGVRAHRPEVTRDFLDEKSAFRLQIGATLVDGTGGILSGSAPLHIRVTDSLGVTRYDLYRATALGSFTETLPLAANDPAGQWTVVIRELLANNESRATFDLAPPRRAPGVAGAPQRALAFGNDLDNVFRFARLHHDVTIVAGSGDFNNDAAARLTRILEPWGVRCKTMPLADAAKSRTLTDDEAPTWSGLAYSGGGQIKPGPDNRPEWAGFAVQGPVILLGNAQDNPILKFLQEQRFLPYDADPASFPGRSRGIVSWQRDGVGRGQESVTLIAYDAEGMNEAVGTLYEAVAGLQPLAKWTLPTTDALAAATHAPRTGTLETVWTTNLPDRITALKLSGSELTTLSLDGTLTTLDASGKVTSTKPGAIEPASADASALKPYERPDRIAKLAATNGDLTAVAYWGGTLSVFDRSGALKATHQSPQDITALLWSDTALIVGDADGRVRRLKSP